MNGEKDSPQMADSFGLPRREDLKAPTLTIAVRQWE